MPDRPDLSVAAYVPDLMDRSRLTAAIGNVQFVANAADLAATDSEIVVLDLGRPGAVEALALLGDRRCIGFASHVDTAVIRAAAAAGCGRVLPRSRFFADVATALG